MSGWSKPKGVPSKLSCSNFLNSCKFLLKFSLSFCILAGLPSKMFVKSFLFGVVEIWMFCPCVFEILSSSETAIFTLCVDVPWTSGCEMFGYKRFLHHIVCISSASCWITVQPSGWYFYSWLSNHPRPPGSPASQKDVRFHSVSEKFFLPSLFV